MLEELVLDAVRWGVFGGDLRLILDMDVVSFSFMSTLMARIDLRERYLTAWTNMVSAQGTHKGMAKWTKPWLQVINGEKGGVPSSGGPPSDDSAAFKAKFGKGI